LLAKVAATYESLTEYQVDFQTTSGAGNLPLPILSPTAHSRLISAGPDKVRYEPNGTERAYIRDGSRFLTYRADLNQYKIDDYDSPDVRRLRMAQERYFTRFRALPKMHVRAVIAGHEDVKSGDEKIDCTIVRLTPLLGTAYWTEQLWIDSTRGLVVRSVHQKLSGTRSGTRLKNTITTWNVQSLGNPSNQRLLDFASVGRAKRVERFSRGSAPMELPGQSGDFGLPGSGPPPPTP
jgi:outer membrane lipoprotein-sorting protein